MFSHRCAALAVWRARRRRRLHDDVGHITGVISALLDQLKHMKHHHHQLGSFVRMYICAKTGEVDLHFLLSMIICEYCARSFTTLCEYLAVLRQDHRLGVAELLLHVMLGVMEVGIGTAEPHRAQGVRGGGALHALHGGGGGFKSQGQFFLGQWGKGTDKKRGRNMTDLLCEHAPNVVLHLQILSKALDS